MGESKRRQAAGASVEKDFQDYTSHVRKRIKNISDIELGQGWMRGEMIKASGGDLLVLHPVGQNPERSDKELKIWMRYGEQKLTAVLPVNFIDTIVSDWRRLMEMLPPSKDQRHDTRDFLMRWLLQNKPIDQPGVQNHCGAFMATGLIWLHFTGPLAPMLRSAVNKPVSSEAVEIGYDITDLPGDRNYNWRTCFYP